MDGTGQKTRTECNYLCMLLHVCVCVCVCVCLIQEHAQMGVLHIPDADICLL
jgi:hypothetical protein